MKREEAISLAVRYGILIILGFGIESIYFIFRPLTVYPVYFILDWVYNTDLVENGMVVNGIFVEIIDACIAGSAYYLLLILNLMTPMMIGKRIENIVFLFGGFLVINIIRIVFMVFLFFSGYEYFNLAHKAFWYIGSTIMLVGIWFIGVRIFRIKDIPVYSDLRSLMGRAI